MQLEYNYLFNFAVSHIGGGFKRLHEYAKWFNDHGGAYFIIHPHCENLITEFILTKINKSYLGDTNLNLAFFENWSKEILNSNDNYTIMRLIPNYLQNNKNMSEKSQNEIKKI